MTCAFSPTLTTVAFDHSRSGWFEACTGMPAPKGLPSSLLQLRTIMFALVAQRFSSSAPEPRPESRLLYPGHHMDGNQVSSMLFPEKMSLPGFDVICVHFEASTRRFTCVRLSGPHMT